MKIKTFIDESELQYLTKGKKAMRVICFSSVGDVKKYNHVKHYPVTITVNTRRAKI